MKTFFWGVGLFFVGSCAAWRLLPASFSVTNGSDQEIHSLTVSVAEKTFQFENIPPGGKVSGWFYFSGEATFGLDGHFANGTPISDSSGYLVWESIAPHCSMFVKPDGIVTEERYLVTPTAPP